jgi:hypothetical protein
MVGKKKKKCAAETTVHEAGPDCRCGHLDTLDASLLFVAEHCDERFDVWLDVSGLSVVAAR